MIGTLLREGGVSTILETELGRDEVLGWLADAYETAGWTVLGDSGARGGFQRAEARYPSRFCRGQDVVHVTLVTGGERLSVRYHQHEESPVSCDRMQRDYDTDATSNFEFPALVSPENADQRGQLSCSGPNEQAIGTGLVTNLSAAEVADHYGRQLTVAGWLPVAACWDGPVAVQVWQIEGTDDPLRGLLLVSERGVQTDVLLDVAWELPE